MLIALGTIAGLILGAAAAGLEGAIAGAFTGLIVALAIRSRKELQAREVDIIVNTPSGGLARADGYEIRAAAVAADTALFTTMAVLGAAVSAMPALREGFQVRSPQEYAADRAARA